MPIMDGFQATGEIRQQVNDSIQIVALTAYTNDSFRKKCLQAGMNDFLTKPIDVQKLEKILLAQE